MRKTIALLSLTFLLASCQQDKEINSLNVSETPIISDKVTPTPSTSTEQSLTGYLHVGQHQLLFLNWTAQDNQLNGSMQVSYVNNDTKQLEVDTSSYPFTGVNNKDSVSLNFSGGFLNGLNGKTITGTFSKKELTLYFPNDTGILEEVVFKTTSVEEYNNAVKTLSQVINETNEIQREQDLVQQQVQANATQKEKEQDAVIRANQSLKQNIDVLKEKLNNRDNFETMISNVLANYETHWKEMNKNKQKLITASKVQPFDYDQLYIVKDIHYAIGDNKYSIGDDTYNFGDIEWSITNYLNELQSGLNDIEKGWTLLKTASSQNTSGAPKPQFTEDEITAFNKNIQGEINKTISLLNTNKKMSIQYEEKAEKLVEEMNAFVNALEVSSSE